MAALAATNIVNPLLQWGLRARVCVCECVCVCVCVFGCANMLCYVQALHRRNGWYVQPVERRTARDGELYDDHCENQQHLQEKTGLARGQRNHAGQYRFHAVLC